MNRDPDDLSLPEIVDVSRPGSGDGRRSADLRGRLALPGRRRPIVSAADGRQIVCEGLVRIYKVADLEVVALQGLDLVVGSGEMVAIVGASGSGKSTLLNILGGLDTPSAGRAVVAGHDLGQMGRGERTRYRRRVVGMIWQQTARNLLPYLTAQENVELPMTLDGRSGRAERARRLLELVGLGPRADHRPERLSGGEQQRVAIAVSLANEPEVLFADEPTGELDTTTSTETVRRTEFADGEHRVISEEFAVLDRAGRLQLPKTHVAALGLKDRVRLRLEEDHVGIWPDRAPAVPPVRPARSEPADAPGAPEETEP